MITIQNEALNDYPEDRALLARKAQKAAKEVAAKQAPNPDQVSRLLITVLSDPYSTNKPLKCSSGHFLWFTA